MENVVNRHLQQQSCNEWIFRDVPSDITIEVCGVTFALHKFPLISKSGRIRNLVTEQQDPSSSKLELQNLPGGSETFELAAKFCYDINIEITPANIAQLCCISDYLEMNEDFSTDNLGSRVENYIDNVICKSLKMCVEVLKNCESLLPLADELRIVSRCIEGISSKACVDQIASSFSRLEYSNSGRLHMGKTVKCEEDWWIKNLSDLKIDLYQKVITAMKCRGVRAESIGASLMNYAHNKLTKKSNEKIVLETVVSLLPVEKSSVEISFLFVMLRNAIVLDCSVSCRMNLERRIGHQLDMATVDDLLILCLDVDSVYRILVSFSQQDDSEDEMENEDESVFESESNHSPSQMALYKVSKLVDIYLAEIALDVNLKLSKFLVIAESLPAHARTVHDGLYQAIDVYLKAHQDLPEVDKRRLCQLIDFKKLSQEAGGHAAQNERLPLQSVVQVLYVEQLRLRNALFCSYPEDETKPMFQSWRVNSGAVSASLSSPKDNYASLRRENRELKMELARLRMRLNDLEKDHVSMKMRMEKKGSCKFMGSFGKRISFFRQGSLMASSSTSKLSHRIDSKVTDRTF